MAVLKVLEYPDPRLRTVAQPVTRFDSELERLAADMFETMYESGGIGLAATQVDVHRRLLVLDISESTSEDSSEGTSKDSPEEQREQGGQGEQGEQGRDKTQGQVFVNPTFKVVDETLFEYDEGCLSVPGFFEAVRRPRAIEVSAQDVKGEPFTLQAEGLLAVCIQHEIDHLDGKLFVDYLSALKRQRIRSKLEKEQRRERQERRVA